MRNVGPAPLVRVREEAAYLCCSLSLYFSTVKCGGTPVTICLITAPTPYTSSPIITLLFHLSVELTDPTLLELRLNLSPLVLVLRVELLDVETVIRLIASGGTKPRVLPPFFKVGRVSESRGST